MHRHRASGVRQRPQWVQQVLRAQTAAVVVVVVVASAASL
jgi:hypothetical protein